MAEKQELRSRACERQTLHTIQDDLGRAGELAAVSAGQGLPVGKVVNNLYAIDLHIMCNVRLIQLSKQDILTIQPEEILICLMG